MGLLGETEVDKEDGPDVEAEEDEEDEEDEEEEEEEEDADDSAWTNKTSVLFERERPLYE